MSDESQLLRELLALCRLIHADEITSTKEQFLGEGNRRKIYEACEEPMTMRGLAGLLGISSQAVSVHTALLVDAGLLQVEKEDRPHKFTRLL